jgi:integrase
VDLYKRVRSTRVTGVTLNIELRTLKAAFNIAHRWGYIQTNPFAHVKLMRIDDTPPAFLSVDEFKRIISGIPDDWFRRAIIIAGLSGLRRGELINLRWSDVDLAAKMFKIQSHDGFRTKFGKRRLVPIHPEVYSILKILELEKNGMYVLQEGGNKILDRRLTKRFKERLRRLTMDERLHFHSLRHSYASWLIQTRAASIYEVQQILGHSSIKITESYSHLLPENLGRTVEALRVELD